MKVILTDEVIGLGEPGKVVDVAPGYARNYLVPRKLAVYADTGRLRELEHHRRRLERKRQRVHAVAQTTAERLAGHVLQIQARAGKGDKLYGSVTTADIAEALKQQFDVVVDRRKIHLREPIRALGTHEAELHLIGETRVTIPVHVVDVTHPEEEVAEQAPLEAPEVTAEAAPEETEADL